jgi:hypothetical protein
MGGGRVSLFAHAHGAASHAVEGPTLLDDGGEVHKGDPV